MAIDVSLEDIKRLTPRFTVNQHIQPVYELDFMFAAAPVLCRYHPLCPAVRTKRLLLCHRPQRIRAAPPESPATGRPD